MKRSSKRRGNRLSLQRLESRQLMAGDVGLIDGTLSLQGTEMDDVAEVYAENDTVVVKLSTYDNAGQIVNEISDSFDASEVDRIVFQAGDGSDMMVNDTSIRSIVRAGAGDDLLLGGSGDDVLIGGTGDDLILGGGGNDRVLAGPGQNTSITSGAVDPVTEDAAPMDSPVPDPAVPPTIDPPADSAVAPEDDDDQPQPPQAQDDTTTPPLADSPEDLTDTDPPADDSADSMEPETCLPESEELPIGNLPAGAIDPPVTEVTLEEVASEAPATTTDSEENAVDDAPVEQEEVVVTSDDIIFGGAGSDLLYGDEGNDMIFGDMSPLDDELMRGVIAGRFGL